MSFLDSLMGGGGGDVPPSSKLRNLDLTPRAFRDLRGPLASTVGGATSGTTPLNLRGIPGYSGDYTADPTDREMSLISQLFRRAGGTSAMPGFDAQMAQFAGGNTALQQAGEADILKTLNGDYLQPGSNPFLAGAIEGAVAPLRQEWENTIMPNLKLGFTKNGQTITGFGSSPFDRAAALASNEYTRKVGDIGQQMSAQNYENERGRIMTALGLGQSETAQRQGAQTSGIAAQQGQQELNQAERQQQTDELVTTLQSVALPRLIEQYGMDQGATEYRNRLSTLMQALGLQATLATGTYANMPPSNSSAGLAPGLISAAGNIGAGAAYSSDRRLKTDIRPLGATVNGTPLYEFKYVWDSEGDSPHWGVIAQEAPPHVVRVMPSGFLAVNYPALVGA